MGTNKIETIDSLRTLDGVLQQTSKTEQVWKPVIQAIKNVTGVFSIEPYDIGKYIRVDSAVDIELTIPNNDRFPIGGVISFEQTGVGIITLVGAIGITLNGGTSSSEQYAVIQAIKVSNTEWTIVGGII